MEYVHPLVMGEIICELRACTGTTQQQIASSMGLRQSAVSKIENGQRSLLAAELISLVAHYGQHFTLVLDGLPPIEIGPVGTEQTQEVTVTVAYNDMELASD